ncbi:hypothetical protein pdam_00011638 [Pocillopora damicornis]|uniref:Sema domain-containing protein n=1 Tax=Pocillopora damicornis TaxID=46731 RepID=A0A3M6UDM7_POCDA|nr:hypothetical protein pdam_00011638 [Pocillopora damicornis]
MKQRNKLYVLLLSYFAILSGWIVVAFNGEPHSRVHFEVVNHHMETLKTGGIESGNFSVLSVDSKYNQLLVGARENAFLVDLGDINSFESWNLTSPSLGCDKGQRTNLDAAPGRDRNQNVFINDENYHSRPSQNDTGVITGYNLCLNILTTNKLVDRTVILKKETYKINEQQKIIDKMNLAVEMCFTFCFPCGVVADVVET